MRVALVSGSWPPDRCGVGDYVSVLADALEQAGASVLRVGRRLGTIGGLPATSWEIAGWKPDLVHIQYPSTGYGRSLAPSLLAVLERVPVVTTLHEFAIFRWYRRPWFALLAAGSRAVVVSSEAERAVVARRIPGSAPRLRVIPIGSNIPAAPAVPSDPDLACHFGLVMRGKGLEAFLAFVAAVRQMEPGVRFRLVGAVYEAHRTYADGILEQARSLGVELLLDRSPADVAVALRQSRYAYLPFPDGASEKRGSLLAALVNGMVVMTPHGEATAAWIRAATIEAGTPAMAAERLMALRRGTLAPPPPPPPLDWPTIAHRHLALYRNVTG